jgi:hypothetical protein
MVKYTKKRVERMIEHEKKRMQPLIDNFEDLSKWGLWTIGYCKGRISLLEDLLDEAEENEDETYKRNEV